MIINYKNNNNLGVNDNIYYLCIKIFCLTNNNKQ